MRIAAERLWQLGLLNTAMIGLNSLALAYLVLREEPDGSTSTTPVTVPSVVAPPTLPAGAATTGPATTDHGAGGASPAENFLKATIGALRTAGTELGKEVALPTDAEVAACVAAGDLQAAACSAPLAQLEAGFDQVGMPFPTLPVPPLGGGGAQLPGEGRGTAGAAGGQVLAVYLDSVQERLRQVAVQKGDDPAAVLPAAAAVQAAVASGDPASAASAPVLQALRAGYARYGLRFPEPGPTEPAASPSPAATGASSTPGAAGSSTSPAGVATEAELLASYLDLVLRKLERAAVDQGRDPADFKPSAEEVAAAVRSGRVDSAEATRVLTRLRASYAELDLPFIEPGGG